MTNGYSAKEFINFIDYLADKGLLKKATASARKAAAVAFLDILDEDEKLDIRAIDLDNLAMRFANIQGAKFTPQSLTTYKSRYNSALKDFLSYRENPLGFVPNISQRSKRGKAKPEKYPVKSATSATTEDKPAAQPSVTPDLTGETIIFPIPLRKGVIVKVAGVPVDLTSTEAEKISDVIKALATE